MGAGGEAVLECRDLRKSWGGIHALAGITLSVGRAEILGLAGANGAGKTTLLNAVGGQTRLDQGDVSFKGRRIDRMSPMAIRRLGLGRTFQKTRVISSRRVLENVALAAEYGVATRRLPPLRITASARSRATEALAIVGLTGLDDVTADELGVYAEKKLMLAMALVPEPELLLLDEPAGGLSPAEVEDMAGIVRSLKGRGITIILVDHVMSFITALADRMVVLHEGQVLAEGTANEIIHDKRVRDTWLGDPNAAEPAA